MRNPFDLQKQQGLTQSPKLGKINNPYAFSQGSSSSSGAGPIVKGTTYRTASIPYEEQNNPYLKLQSLNNQIGNMKGLYNSMGVDPTKATDDRNWVEKMLNLKQNQGAFSDIMETLQRPQQAVMGALDSGNNGMLQGAFKGLTGQRRLSGVQAVQDLTGYKAKGGLSKFMTELGADVVTDPLMLIPGESLFNAGKFLIKKPLGAAASVLRTTKKGNEIMDKLSDIGNKTLRGLKTKFGTFTNKSYKDYHGASRANQTHVFNLTSKVNPLLVEQSHQINKVAQELEKDNSPENRKFKKLLTGNRNADAETIKGALNRAHIQEMEQTKGINGLNLLRSISENRSGLMIPEVGYKGDFANDLLKETNTKNASWLNDNANDNPHEINDALQNLAQNQPKDSEFHNVSNLNKQMENYVNDISSKGQFDFGSEPLLKYQSNGGRALTATINGSHQDKISSLLRDIDEKEANGTFKKLGDEAFFNRLKGFKNGSIDLNLNDELDKKFLKDLSNFAHSSNAKLRVSPYLNGKAVNVNGVTNSLFSKFLKSPNGTKLQDYIQEKFGNSGIKQKTNEYSELKKQTFKLNSSINENIKSYTTSNRGILLSQSNKFKDGKEYSFKNFEKEALDNNKNLINGNTISQGEKDASNLGSSQRNYLDYKKRWEQQKEVIKERKARLGNKKVKVEVKKATTYPKLEEENNNLIQSENELKKYKASINNQKLPVPHNKLNDLFYNSKNETEEIKKRDFTNYKQSRENYNNFITYGKESKIGKDYVDGKIAEETLDNIDVDNNLSPKDMNNLVKNNQKNKQLRTKFYKDAMDKDRENAIIRAKALTKDKFPVKSWFEKEDKLSNTIFEKENAIQEIKNNINKMKEDIKSGKLKATETIDNTQGIKDITDKGGRPLTKQKMSKLKNKFNNALNKEYIKTKNAYLAPKQANVVSLLDKTFSTNIIGKSNFLGLLDNKEFSIQFRNTLGINNKDIDVLKKFIGEEKVSLQDVNKLKNKTLFSKFTDKEKVAYTDVLKKIQVGIKSETKFFTANQSEFIKVFETLDSESKDYMVKVSPFDDKQAETLSQATDGLQGYIDLKDYEFKVSKSPTITEKMKESLDADMRALIRKEDFKYNNLLNNLQVIQNRINGVLSVAGEGSFSEVFENMIGPGYIKHSLSQEARLWKQTELLTRKDNKKPLIALEKSLENSISGGGNLRRAWVGTLVDINSSLNDKKILDLKEKLGIANAANDQEKADSIAYQIKDLTNKPSKLFIDDPLVAMANRLEITPSDMLLQNSIGNAINAGMIIELPEDVLNNATQNINADLKAGKLNKVNNNKWLLSAINKELARHPDYKEFQMLDEGAIENIKKLIVKISRNNTSDEFKNEWLPKLNQISNQEGNNIHIIHIGVNNRLKTYAKTVDGHNDFTGVFKVARNLMSVWKQTALFTLGFHTRNFISNHMNAFVSGVSVSDTMKHLKDAIPLTYKFHKKIPEEIQNALLNHVKEFGEIKDAALSQKIIEKHMDNIGEGYAYNKYLEYSSKGLLGATRFSNDMFDLTNTLHKTLKEVQSNRKSSTLKLFKTLSKNNLAATKGADDAFRISMYEFAKTEKGIKLLNKDRIFDADGNHDGVKFSKRVFFDYIDTTDFENKYMKSLFPFYTWMRKNIELQVHNMMNHPKRYLFIKDLIGSLQQSQMSTPNDITQYERDSLLLPMPDLLSNDPNNITFIKANWPILDIPNFLNKGAVLGRLNPFIQYPLESMTGTDFFTGKKTNTPMLSNMFHQFFWDKEGLKSLFNTHEQTSRKDMGLVGQRLSNVMDPIAKILGYKGGVKNVASVLPSIFNSSNKINNRTSQLQYKLFLYRQYLNKLRAGGTNIPFHNWYGPSPNVQKFRKTSKGML